MYILASFTKHTLLVEAKNTRCLYCRFTAIIMSQWETVYPSTGGCRVLPLWHHCRISPSTSPLSVPLQTLASERSSLQLLLAILELSNFFNHIP